MCNRAVVAKFGELVEMLDPDHQHADQETGMRPGNGTGPPASELPVGAFWTTLNQLCPKCFYKFNASPGSCVLYTYLLIMTSQEILLLLTKGSMNKENLLSFRSFQAQQKAITGP